MTPEQEAELADLRDTVNRQQNAILTLSDDLLSLATTLNLGDQIKFYNDVVYGLWLNR